ncbi:MAG: secondary thiamine-phosphate synthase enzyme YjbQ [Candidatus Omnitrophota bacterium]
MKTINVRTTSRQDVVDITAAVRKYLVQEKADSGILVVYSPHTTAAITVNENADPDVKRDITSFLNHAVPSDFSFRHAEGNSDAHIKGSLTGFSQIFIVENGEVQLGTWQGIFLMEYDGPRQRNVWLKFIAEKK